MEEYCTPDAGNAIRDRDARQAGALTKNTFTDAGELALFTKIDTLKAFALPEGITPDTGDTNSNRDDIQAIAILEGRLPEAGESTIFPKRETCKE